jgi:hypothetical protein
MSQVKSVTLPVTVLILSLLLVGCTTLKPCRQAYPFLSRHPEYRSCFNQVYHSSRRNNAEKIKLMFTHPEGDILDFGGAQHPIDSAADRPLALGEGMYPVRLLGRLTRQPHLCGALMVYNLNREIGLATLGLTDDTRLFKPELLEKAAGGTLITHTIKFDKTNVLTYWIGNRTDVYRGGVPTVQVDFSGTPGIREVRIDGRVLKGFVATLPVYAGGARVGSGRRREFKLELTCRDRSYVGYLQKLADNEFTAFMRIPCAIEQSLLDAAAKGTVSQVSVLSRDEKRERVAEILVSTK